MSLFKGYLGYGVALLATGAVALLRFGFDHAVSESTPHFLLPFVVPIFLAGWSGGWRSGLFATALNTLVAAYYFIEPAHGWGIANPGDRARLGVFVLVGVLVSWLTGVLHRHQRQAEAGAADALRRWGDLKKEVAERQRAENEELRLVTDHAPVLIAHCDAERRYKFVNSPYAERFGLDPTEVVGKPLAEVMGDRAYLQARPHIDAALTGKPAEFETPAPFDERRALCCAYRPEFDRTGRVAGFLTVMHDVTGRVRAEEALRESEARYRMLAETLPNMTWLMRPDLTLEYLNRPGCEYTGRSMEQINAGGWASVVHPDDLSAVRAAMDESRRHGEPYQAGCRYRRHDGMYRWVIMRAVPVKDDAGVVTTWVGSATDVHDHRLAEERLRTVVESIPIGVFLTNRDGKIVLTNPTFDRMFGYDPGELLGESVERLVPRRYRGRHPAYRAGYYANAQTKAMGSGRDLWGLRKDGSEFPVEVGLNPVDMETGLHVLASVIDISARRAAAHALRESEARFRQLADAMPQIVWAAGPDGTVDYYNRRWYEWTGAREGETGDTSWLPVLHPEDRERCHALWYDAVRTGEPFQVEYRFRFLLTGSYRWHLCRALPVRDGSGRVVRWYGTSTDIDDRKRTEQALQDSERRFRLLLEGLPLLAWTCRGDGRCDYLSRQWVEYTGIPEAEQLDYGWAQAVHPDDHPRLMGRWRAAVESGRPFDVEFRIRSAGGEYRWFKTRAIRFARADGSSKWFGTNTDIDDQKHAEQELKELNASLEQRVTQRSAELEQRARELRAQTRLMESILNSIAEGVAVADEEGKPLLLNPAGERLVGVGMTTAPPSEWSRLCHLFRPDDGTPFPFEQLPLVRAIRGEPTDNVEMVVRNPNFDRPVHLGVTGRPLVSDEGVIKGGVVVFHDTTARRLTEEQTRASLREKEALLKEIHHRVKNNLQIVSTLLDLQSDHLEDRRAREMFEESRGRVKSMALIHERLYQSQDLARVNFAEYVRQLAADLCRTYRVPGSPIVLHVEVTVPPLPIDVAIPCGLLINELVSNALKHGFPAGREGRIRVSLHADGGDNLLTVADNGAGFPAALDYRNSPSFGLQLVNTLVYQLGGRFDLCTAQGTAFTVRFPDNGKSPEGTSP